MHPEIPSRRSTTKNSLKMGKDHPFLTRIIMNLGEWNNLWSNCCSALKRCHPYNRNEWNQISPSSKFLKYNIYIYGWFGVYFLMIPLGVSQSQERSPWTEKRALKWQLIALWIIWSHIATLGYTPNQPSLQKISERRGDGKTQFPSIFLGDPAKFLRGGSLLSPQVARLASDASTEIELVEAKRPTAARTPGWADGPLTRASSRQNEKPRRFVDLEISIFQVPCWTFKKCRLSKKYPRLIDGLQIWMILLES